MLSAALANALVNGYGGQPGMSAGRDALQLLIARNRLETQVLGPLFGGPGAATSVLGGSPQQVSAANQFGAEAFLAATAGQWGGTQKSLELTGGVARPAINAGIRWGEGIQNQGMPWETYLETQLPAGSRLPPNFKTFDFYEPTTGTAISAKTLDTMTEGKLVSPAAVYSSLKRNVDAAASYDGSKLSGESVKAEEINSRQLRVAVPVTTSREQWMQIEKAIQYGQANGVNVIVTPVSNQL